MLRRATDVSEVLAASIIREIIPEDRHLLSGIYFPDKFHQVPEHS
jgi:hypothetical protein